MPRIFYYYLKQMQARTPMIVVLDQVKPSAALIEWYGDKSCIKVHRTKSNPIFLPAKSCIRFMYKDGESRNGGSHESENHQATEARLMIVMLAAMSVVQPKSALRDVRKFTYAVTDRNTAAVL